GAGRGTAASRSPAAGSSSPVDRREPGEQLGPRGQALVEGRIRIEELAGDRLGCHGQRLDREALRRGSVVEIDGRQPLAGELLGVGRDREGELVVLVLLRGRGGTLQEEDRGVSAGDDENEGARGAVDQRVVSGRLRGENRGEALEESEALRGQGADADASLLEGRLDRAQHVAGGPRAQKAARA